MRNKEIKTACEKIMKLENEVIEIMKENDLQGFYQLTDTFIRPYIKVDNDGIVLINNREICKAEEIEEVMENFENEIQSVTIFSKDFKDTNEDKTVWIIRKKWNEREIDVQKGF